MLFATGDQNWIVLTDSDAGFNNLASETWPGTTYTFSDFSSKLVGLKKRTGKNS